jgi:acyl carrier protein
MDIKIKLDQILYFINKKDVSDLNEKSRLKEDLNFDSINLMQIRIEIEKEFDIYIEDSQLLLLKTKGDLYNTVISLLGK